MSKCKVCTIEYTREREGQVTCSFTCAITYGQKYIKKASLDKSKVARRQKKEFLDTDIKHLKKVAQKKFNEFIRLRDKNLPCISCGTTNNIQYHAGHYKPQGGFGYLRFNELNVHKQCSVCNNHKSGNLVPYKVSLIAKIGLEAVEILEKPNQIKKWTAEELLEVIRVYKIKIKELK